MIMAHVSHFKKSDCKRVANEYSRDEKFLAKEKAKQESRIHFEKTKDNYKIGEQNLDLNQQIENRLADENLKVSSRKDLNVMSDWVITCPIEITEPDEQKRFFNTVYDFTSERYGKANVLTGFVHMDETTPHMHLPVVPVKDGRVSSKALFNKSELQNYQRDLDKKIADEFGCSGLILNGRTKGDFTVEELKERDKANWKIKVAEEQYKKMHEEKQALRERETSIVEREKALALRESRLKAREATLSSREDINKRIEALEGSMSVFNAYVTKHPSDKANESKKRYNEALNDIKKRNAQINDQEQSQSNDFSL